KFIIRFCLLGCMVSCGKSVYGTHKVGKETTLPSLSKQKNQKDNYTEYFFDPKVKKITNNWVKYNELEDVMMSLKQADLTYFKENHEILEALITDLKQSLPETLNSPAIMSRLIALETKLYKLESLVNLSNATPESIMPGI